MKAFILLAIAGFVVSCSAEKEIQMSLEDVQLVKIDTVSRYPNAPQQLLTWHSENNIAYITFEPITASYSLGSRMKVMIRR